MSAEPISEEARRFILTSIASVPHLEAILLLRSETGAWDSTRAAQRLYVSDKTAEQLLSDLYAAGILSMDQQETPLYRYAPSSDDLRQMIDLVAAAYAKNIVEVTNLIHSSTSKKAQQFADAFKLRKDP
jgi:hypothetical protein